MDADRNQRGNSTGDDDVDDFSDPTRIVPPVSWEQLRHRLRQVFAQDSININFVRALMASYKSNPEDWEKYAMFDKEGYTHNLVDEVVGKFNLMVLCWREAATTAVHNHADSHCFYKVLEGKMKEERFDWPQGSKKGHQEMTQHEMIPRQEQQFSRDQSSYISDGIGLHIMKNASHEDTAVTLHLYSPPYIRSFDFDQRNGEKHINTLHFWSEYGKRTPDGVTQDQQIEQES